MMTLEKIEAKMAELEAAKKKALEREKARELLERRRAAAKQRKLLSRVKYIIGGYSLAKYPKAVEVVLNDPSTRPQDKKTLEQYQEALQKS